MPAKKAPDHTIRVPDRTYQILRRLAGKGNTLQAVIVQAVENLRRERLLEEANAAFAALRQDPSAWDQERQERALWEETLGDGLEDE